MVAVYYRPLDRSGGGRRPIEFQDKRLNRAADVLQIECTKFLESEIEPAMHMIANRPRNADVTRWTLGLEPRRHIHNVAMYVSPIWDHIANVDADAEANGTVGGLIAI